MTRATGGSAWAATSTRSRFLPYAYSRASSVVLIPSCSPSSPIRRTRGTRIASLIRVCGVCGRSSRITRLGLKGSSPSSLVPFSKRQNRCKQRHSISDQPARLNPLRPCGREVRLDARLLSGSKRSNLGHKFIQGRRELLAAARAHGERLLALAVAVHDRERDLLDLGVANPLADRLGGVVYLDTDARLAQLRGERRCGRLVVRADRHDTHLDRREPVRERTAVVLDEDADEPLERPEQCAVDHIWHVLSVVGAH